MSTDKRGKQSPDYHAFLLRCWHADDGWRFSLESIGDDRQRRGFHDLLGVLTAVSTDLEIDNPPSEQRR